MCQIIKEHGLVPVPFEFDVETMHPVGVDIFKTLISEKVIQTLQILGLLIMIDRVCFIRIPFWYKI
jgi:hypothetical protein